MSEGKQISSSVFWFRQDLRVRDNTGLIQAVRQSHHIFPIFILDQTLISQCKKEDPRLGFLRDALKSLDTQLQECNSRLHVFTGDPVILLPQIIKESGSRALFYNRSYGSGSVSRDPEIQKRCHHNGVLVKSYNDYLLVEPGSVEARKVFTPFYKLWQNQRKADVHDELPVFSPFSPKIKNERSLDQIFDHLKVGENKFRPVTDISKRIKKIDFGAYDLNRNYPSNTTGTSHMSPYIRFGLVSIRELYHISKDRSPTFVSELAWREFWHHIAYHFPESRFQEFQEKRRNLEWLNTPERGEKRKNGETGYPLVDAGMRQLKTENRMHNRVRMVVASFLCKDLLSDRRYGEEHFAQYLLDYDMNVNIGNRQWAASVGADPKPLRIFNPSLQSQRFDPEAAYIRKRIPELKNIPLEHIHNPEKYSLPYASPLVLHKEYSQYAKRMYAKQPLDITHTLFP